jgi:hypothetical protein
MKRVVLVILVCGVLGLVGCGPKVPAAEQVAAEQKAQCFKTQGLVLQAMKLFYADSGTYPPIEIVTAKLQATCPAEGTYTFSETTEKVTCSVHGSP